MRLIPNEIKYAEKCLQYNRIDKTKPYRSIREVILYFKLIHEMGFDDILENVWGYVQNCNMEHKVNYEYLRDKYIHDVIKTTKDMREILSVGITAKELESIMNNNYPNSYRKILFVLLVAFKCKYATNGIKNDKVDMDDSVIFKDAHVTMVKQKRYDMWRIFESDGYITLGEDSKANEIHLHYIDYDSEDYEIRVTDFDDYYIFFEQYRKGGRLVYCEKCGDLVLTSGNNRKYCKGCAKEVKLEQNKKSKNNPK